MAADERLRCGLSHGHSLNLGWSGGGRMDKNAAVSNDRAARPEPVKATDGDYGLPLDSRARLP
jgi:hypothetical protein